MLQVWIVLESVRLSLACGSAGSKSVLPAFPIGIPKTLSPKRGSSVDESIQRTETANIFTIAGSDRANFQWKAPRHFKESFSIVCGGLNSPFSWETLDRDEAHVSLLNTEGISNS
jgi:hypothetical protein